MKLRLSILLYLFSLLLFSQEPVKKRLYYKRESLATLLFKLEKIYEVKFSYLDATVAGKRVTVAKKEYLLPEVLQLLTRRTGLVFKKIDTHYYAVYNPEKPKDFFANASGEVLTSVIIHAYLAKGISKSNDNTFRIEPQKLGVLPGLSEPDVLQTLQQLPGVISPGETVTGIYVRGGTPDQNLILWDGIPMYHNGHMFGMISGFNSNINQTIRFIDKGTPPEFGGRISSVIDIKTNDKIPEKTKVSAGFNLLSLDANINVPLVKDKVKLQVSGRRSFTDCLPTITLNRMSQAVFQNTKIAKLNDDNIFYFRDYNAKLFYKISKKSSLALNTIMIDNNLDNFYPDTENQFFFHDKMKINNKGYSARFETTLHTTRYTLQSFYSYYDFKYDNYIDKYNSGADKEVFTKKNIIVDSGISFDVLHTINPYMHLQAGYQYLAQDVSHAFISITPYLDFVIDSNDAFLQTHAVYTAFNFSKKNWLHGSFGLRSGYVTGIDQFFVEPRVNLNYKITDRLKLNATAEIKNQIISQIQETVINSINIENQLWVLSNEKRYPAINLKHYSMGLTYKREKWIFDIDTYIKHAKGLTSLTFGFFNSIDPVYHRGENSIIGSDLYIEKDFKHLRTWLTYSFSSSKNKFEGINKGKNFSNNKEIKYAVNLGMSYKWKTWQVALGWNWHAGKPYTILEEDENGIFAGQEIVHINQGQLPDYHRLDISTIRHFFISKSKKTKAKLGVSFYNLYNRKNLLDKEYYFDSLLDDDLHLRERYSLQFTPNLFFRLNF